GQPLVAEGVKPQETTFLRVGRGWVAWDASLAVLSGGSLTERPQYRLAWSLAAANGTYQIPTYSSIASIAVNPAGTHIAVSTMNSLFVLRTSDGAEVWRRHQR